MLDSLVPSTTQEEASVLRINPSVEPKGAMTITTTSFNGKTYRRVPEPARLSLRSFGCMFRQFMDEKRAQDRQAAILEDEKWRRLTNSAKAADPDWRQRQQEDALRNSYLYRMAMQGGLNNNRNCADDCVPVAAENYTTKRSPTHHNSSSSVSAPGYIKGLRVRSASSALTALPRRPSVSVLPPTNNRYTPIVTTTPLEKERAEKLYAITHAQQDVLSVSVIEDRVHQLFQGEAAIKDVLALCQQAATLQLQGNSDRLDDVVGPDGTDTLPGHSETAAAVAACRLGKMVPIGREVGRVSRKMNEQSQRVSAVAFERLQAAKRNASRSMSELLAKSEDDLLTLVRSELSKSS